MKENMRRVKSMELGILHLLTNHIIEENFMKENTKVVENINGLMGEFIMENGLITKCSGMECLAIQMVTNMKVSDNNIL